MIERRKTRRGRVLYGAAVDFNERQSVFDCIVRNYSKDGAHISFPDGTSLPDTVNLTIRHRGETISAKTVWRSHDQAGLAFAHDGETGKVVDFATRRKAIRQKVEGFIADDTAGIGLDSLLVIAAGGLVAAGIGHVAGQAIEEKFDVITETLKHLG
jgi:hypothetical protein